VASPLELQFGEIPGLTQMTSASSLGYVDKRHRKQQRELHVVN
jgi:hypothetical protein